MQQLVSYAKKCTLFNSVFRKGILLGFYYGEGKDQKADIALPPCRLVCHIVYQTLIQIEQQHFMVTLENYGANPAKHPSEGGVSDNMMYIIITTLS